MSLYRSLLPYPRRSWWDTFDYPTSILDQHFGTGLFDRDLHPPMLYQGYILRPRTREAVRTSGESEVRNEKDKFQVMLNVNHFKPGEVEVKVIDNFIVIHGKHEEKSDEHGFIQREFTRRYMLPEGTEPDSITSSWSANGVLTIEAPKKVLELPPSNERVVPISLAKESHNE